MSEVSMGAEAREDEPMEAEEDAADTERPPPGTNPIPIPEINPDARYQEVEALKRHHLQQRDRDRMYLPTVGPQPAAQDLDELTVPVRHPDEEVESDEELREAIVATLQTVYDPEIPVNIHALGLIYGIDIDANRRVEVRMTLTAPACPVAGQLVSDVAQKVGAVPGVKEAHVELVWEPFWTPERMTEEARLELGMF